MSPKLISIWAAVWAPTPKPSKSVGAASVVRRVRCWSCGRDFLSQGKPATGKRPEGVLGGCGGRVERARSEGGAAREQTVIGEGVEGFSQVGWRIHADLLQRDHRRGACFPGRIPRDLERPDHLDDTVPGFGGRGRLARQHGPGGALGIDGVGLADGAARVPVPPIHFDDTMPRAADRAGQAGAIAAGALDAKRLDPPVGVGPRDQRPIPAQVGDEGLIAEADPSGVDRHRDVDMLVGVNADDYRPSLGLDQDAGGHGWPPRVTVR